MFQIPIPRRSGGAFRRKAHPLRQQLRSCIDRYFFETQKNSYLWMPVFAILVSKAILKTPSAKQCHRYGVMIHYRRVLDFLDSILIGLYTDSVVDSRLCLFVTVSCTLTYRWYTLLDVSRFLSRFCRGVELYLALAG